MANGESKILIIGATGYLGKFMVKASLSMGYPTYAYVRPNTPRLHLLRDFESMGLTIFQGSLDEKEKFVYVLQHVDVVISTLSTTQYLQQIKIINAIKEAKNIKRFIPSEYGNEVDRVTALPPFQAILENKKKIRRATEVAGIPHTFISANSFAAYFIHYLLHPLEKTDQVIVYGSGEAKAVLNFEQDVASYTIKVATDPKTCNRIVIYRPPRNIVSQLDLILAWEKKMGRNLKRIYVPEEEIVQLSETLPPPDNIRASILHNIFIKGDQMSFELGEDDLEASKLYPDYKYTSVDDVLNICLADSLAPNKIDLV